MQIYAITDYYEHITSDHVVIHVFSIYSVYYSLLLFNSIYFLEIRSMVKSLELPQKDRVKYLEKKLDNCRNKENNPDSQV